MRNVRFNDEVVKHLRSLVRDSAKGEQFRTALTKIYQAGYDNGQDAAYQDARQKLQEIASNDNQSPSAGNVAD